MEKTIARFLVKQKFNLSKEHVEHLILSHPEYPSLLSIADILDQFSIDHKFFKVSEEELNKLPFPYFICKSNGNLKIFEIGRKRDLESVKNGIDLVNSVFLKINTESSDFNNIGVEQYLFSDNLYRTVNIILKSVAVILIVLILVQIQSYYWLNFALLATSVIGIIVGYILVAKDIGLKYKLIEDFCTAGKNADCNKLLESDSAVLFKFIKFSDAVFIYFILQSIILALAFVFNEFSNAFMSILIIMSLLTFPIVIYSFFYQLLIAKAWCRLCLLVDAVLVFQLFLFYCAYSYWNGSTINLTYNSMFAVFLIFVIVSSLVLLIKNHLKWHLEIKNKLAEANRIKYSIKTFTNLLFHNQNIDTTFFEKEIIIGKPTANIKILIVGNLYCPPCKKAHKEVIRLFKKYPNKIQLVFRFIISGPNLSCGKNALSYLTNFWSQKCHNTENESEKTMQLLEDWYEFEDKEKFFQKYPMDMLSIDSWDKIDEIHHSWANIEGIHRTPTLFINGFKMPSLYSIEDIAFMIPEFEYTLIVTKSDNSMMGKSYPLPNVC